MSKEAFDDFELSLGDTVSINVLGRNITATIANTREVEWESFSINFVFILSPGVLENAPHSWIATTYGDDDKSIDAIETAVTDAFSNVSAISVKEAVRHGNKHFGFAWRGHQINSPCDVGVWHCCASWHSGIF